jgi:hypothetical protein
MPFRGGTGDKHSVAVYIYANRQERFFPTSARRRIAPEDQIFIIISSLFADNPHTYIHPSGIDKY